ncbi:hypothetical protein Q6344_06755 [Psychrobacter cibarius]|nr:hypothetical protein Q6344_06755 [Psychrobacter cibarius]
MIESKTLGSAAGVQYQGVIDKTESNSLPSLANGVITGRFKRGRMDKPFKLTASNYQPLLGRDPSNPSYLAVEDAFKRGVSEVSVLRIGSNTSGGGSITCTPSNGFVSNFNEDLPKEWITVSRNGGLFVTFDLNAETTDYDTFSRMTAYGQDGKSLAFIGYPYMIDSGDTDGLGGVISLDSLPVLPIAPKYYYSFLGINTNGIIKTYDGEKDLKELKLKYTFQSSHTPNKPRAEHNWLVFKPTPNVDPANDLFYKMGATGDTLEVHSCAVMEKKFDPNVCMPTYNETMFNHRSGDENPIGEVHAKYRINGEPWQYYRNNDPDVYNVVEYFFESLYHNDWQMIHIGGGNGRAAFATGYHKANIYGASATTEYMRDQDGIVAFKPYTIEFAVTEDSRNDLVYLAFGKDTTIKSCAIGSWMGY